MQLRWGPQYLYALGGSYDQEDEEYEEEEVVSLSIVERFDSNSGGWELVAPLPEARRVHAAAVLSGRLYVLGGWDHDAVLR